MKAKNEYVCSIFKTILTYLRWINSNNIGFEIFEIVFITDTLYIYYSHCLFSVRWQYTSSNCIYFVIYKMNDMVRNKLVICLWVFTQTTNKTCVDKWHYQRNLPKITQIMKRSCYTAECCASIFPSRAPIPFRTLKMKKSWHIDESAIQNIKR